MKTSFDEVGKLALALAPDKREKLVQLLLASINTDLSLEDAWAKEIDRRIDEAERGTVQGIPLEEALAQIRATLK